MWKDVPNRGARPLATLAVDGNHTTHRAIHARRIPFRALLSDLSLLRIPCDSDKMFVVHLHQSLSRANSLFDWSLGALWDVVSTVSTPLSGLLPF
jgi:hypothetical protein